MIDSSDRTPMPISPDEMRLVAREVYRATGIQIPPSKHAQVESRLGPLASESGGYAALMERAGADAEMRRRVVDAITIHETLFFRDRKPFDLLRWELLPRWVRSGRAGPCHILSAACSTGQEPYSIAMTVAEALPAEVAARVEITAIDISSGCLRRAREGVYTPFEVGRGLSAFHLDRHFLRVERGWQVREELGRMVRFVQGNILRGTGGVRRWDIIFCRNVAIYFGVMDRRRLFETLARELRPDGALILGSGEILSNITEAYRREVTGRGSYFRPGGAGISAV